MRAVIFLLSGLILVASCRNETEPKISDKDITLVSDKDGSLASPPYNVEFNEKTQRLSLIRSNESLEGADLNAIISSINKKYQDIKLNLVKAGRDTIELKIDDARQLTQGMGSTGAEAYLAEVTYSLTELKGVKAVKIDFEEGDHAMPGTFTRADFKALTDSAKSK
ncbi:hypothetical protein WG906_16960 [Pedobacter sp. P351]|uniref:hypothetical protein n=1 Tax=Pedobacter superstes TaxID=3133441 RepID=UPI00309B670C